MLFSCIYAGEKECISVKDGEILKYLPELNEEKYDGWYISYSDEKYYDKLPIFEDVELYAGKHVE